MGGGGVIGSGKQYYSWIAIDDVVGAILHCLLIASLRGPVNAVAPNAVTNEQYTHALGRVLQRPTILPMPAFGARLAFGGFADECLLASQRVLPDLLSASGYQFRYPDLDRALRHLLGKEAAAVAL
jgi:NAD dependent epimerase/dehydratase family enzyme